VLPPDGGAVAGRMLCCRKPPLRAVNMSMDLRPGKNAVDGPSACSAHRRWASGTQNQNGRTPSSGSYGTCLRGWSPSTTTRERRETGTVAPPHQRHRRLPRPAPGHLRRPRPRARPMSISRLQRI
jgi:hypothetical protein